MERKKFYLSILIVFLLFVTIGCYFKYYENITFAGKNKIVKISDMDELNKKKKKTAFIYVGNDRSKTALDIKSILRETVKKYNVDLYYIDTDIVESKKNSMIQFKKNDPPRLISVRDNRINGEIVFTDELSKSMVEQIVDFRVSDVVDKTYNIRSFNLIEHVTIIGLLFLFIDNIMKSKKTSIKEIIINTILNCTFIVTTLYGITCKATYVDIMNLSINIMSFEIILGIILAIANTILCVKNVNKYKETN